jgi:hypothetical protein
LDSKKGPFIKEDLSNAPAITQLTSKLQPGTLISLLTMYNQFLQNLRAALKDLEEKTGKDAAGAEGKSLASKASAVVVVGDSSKPFMAPSITVQGLTEVVKSVSEGVEMWVWMSIIIFVMVVLLLLMW